jgi:hypothetical protein
MAKTKTITRKPASSSPTAGSSDTKAVGIRPQLLEWPPKAFDGFRFGTSGPLYTLAHDAKPLDVRDQLDARMNQLVSMTTIVTGLGAEVFHGWSDEIKEGYLWSVAMTVDECKELLALL